MMLLAAPLPAPGAPPPRNVIIMIADGCGSEQYTLARWFKGAPLALDAMAVGQVRTHIANSVVADSAPAATAFATGVMSGQRAIGMAPAEATLPGLPAPAEPYRPLATVAEGARLAGKSVGLVATSRLTHATPAAYLAHVPSRYQENDIMEQMLHQGATVLLGGGRRLCLPREQGGKRGDGQDLWARLSGQGYQLPQSADQLAQVRPGKVAGFFAASHLAAEIDRPSLAPEQPTLAAMTAKALEILGANPKGFFLMVEGSQIDWACHANDPAHLLGDLLMFDRAVEVALEFAKKDGHTLVLAFSDHNTGGMSLGNASTQINYMTTGLGQLLDPLKAMRMSAPALWHALGDNPNPAKLRRALREHWGAVVSPSEAQAMIAAAGLAKLYPKKYEPWYGVGEIFCRSYTVVGWTTHGHTGGDVPLFAYGPGSPHGTLDGPQLGRFTARALGLDMEALNQRLFVEAHQAFGDERVSLRREASGQRVVEISREGGAARLPLNQNRLLLDGREITLEGVVVYAEPTGNIYLPRQAVELIKGEKP